jgi:hypothetical protein
LPVATAGRHTKKGAQSSQSSKQRTADVRSMPRENRGPRREPRATGSGQIQPRSSGVVFSCRGRTKEQSTYRQGARSFSFTAGTGPRSAAASSGLDHKQRQRGNQLLVAARGRRRPLENSEPSCSVEPAMVADLPSHSARCCHTNVRRRWNEVRKTREPGLDVTSRSGCGFKPTGDKSFTHIHREPRPTRGFHF